jgi:hypothetical protein
MARLPQERFLVRPARNPRGSAPKRTLGTLTPMGQRNAGPSTMLPARGRSGRRAPKTPLNVYHTLKGD